MSETQNQLEKECLHKENIRLGRYCLRTLESGADDPSSWFGSVSKYGNRLAENDHDWIRQDYQQVTWEHLCTGARERYQDSSRWSRPSSTSEIMTSYRSISSSSQFSADPRRRQSDSSFYNGGLAQVHITEKLEWSMLSTMNDNIRHDPTCWKRPVRNPISYLSNNCNIQTNFFAELYSSSHQHNGSSETR